VLVGRQKKLGAQHPDVALSLSALAGNLLQQRRWAEAESLLCAAREIWDARRPQDWDRFNTLSLLGESLLGQRKYVEAEPRLLSGYEGIKAREAKLPASKKIYVSEAGERTVQLYEAWGRAEEAVAS
jgi:hypothetical protein